LITFVPVVARRPLILLRQYCLSFVGVCSVVSFILFLRWGFSFHLAFTFFVFLAISPTKVRPGSIFFFSPSRWLELSFIRRGQEPALLSTRFHPSPLLKAAPNNPSPPPGFNFFQDPRILTYPEILPQRMTAAPSLFVGLPFYSLPPPPPKSPHSSFRKATILFSSSLLFLLLCFGNFISIRPFFISP